MEHFLIPQSSLFIGIIPALFILFFVLKGYEGLYKDKKIFLTFLVGIILGVITAFAQSTTSAGLFVYMVLLAFFAQLLKTIVLNLKRFHAKQETAIYGLSLGLGFGASFTPFLVIIVSSLVTTDLAILSLITIGSMSMLFFHAATGVLIGFGIYKKKLVHYLAYSIILQIPFNGLTDFMIIASRETDTLTPIILIICVLLIYSIGLFGYIALRILPHIKPQSGRRKRLQQKQEEKKISSL